MSQTFTMDNPHALRTAYGVNATHAIEALATVKTPTSGIPEGVQGRQRHSSRSRHPRHNVALPRVKGHRPLIGGTVSAKARREQVTQTILAILEAVADPTRTPWPTIPTIPTTPTHPTKETH